PLRGLLAGGAGRAPHPPRPGLPAGDRGRAPGPGPVTLSVRDLRKAFGGVRAVDGVSFDLPRGEVRALIGPNGAGKTTVFNVLGGQLRPDAGEVRLGGERISGLSRTIRRGSCSTSRRRAWPPPSAAS